MEEDNSVMRDLQYLQASMLWLDLGISCGYTRKMQIAEGYLQPLCTVRIISKHHNPDPSPCTEPKMQNFYGKVLINDETGSSTRRGL